ncbi:hypothetical protein HOM50_01645 [bacterium]|jgi:hypothetical protein|nr:hypothetical protein [bacterium]MBT5015090.1 hypothetical protein [bacterium]
MKKLLLLGLLGSFVLGLSVGQVEPSLSQSRNWKNITVACVGAGLASNPISGSLFIKESSSARILSNQSGKEAFEASRAYSAGLVPGALVVGPVLYNTILKSLGQHWYDVSDSAFQKGSYTAGAKRIMRGSKLATALLFTPNIIALAERARIEYRISKSK